MRRRPTVKLDGNHLSIKHALESLPGVLVFDLAVRGDGCPDLLCAFRDRLRLLEIKDPAQPPSKRRLTPAEAEFHARWKPWVAVVETLDDALQALGLR